MAFEPDALSEVFQTIGGTFRAFYYEASDPRSTVLAPGFFTDVTKRGVKPGNLIEVYSAAGETHFTLNVKSVTPAGVAVVEIERQESDLPFIEEVGNPTGDGYWTNVFQLAGLESQKFRLRDQTTYRHGEPAEFTVSGSGLVGSPGSKIYLPAADWTTADYASIENVLASSAFYAHGNILDADEPLEGFTLRGITFESEVLESRLVNGMFLRNVQNIDVCDNEFLGIPTGVAVRVSTVSGQISRNYIHDFLQDAVGPFSFAPQSSGIEIDGFRVDADGESNRNSNDLIVTENRIARLRFTGAASLPPSSGGWGFQSDGINHQGNGKSGGTVIANNRIRDTGEGIDVFCNDIAVTGNVIENAAEHGIKIIHGASRNTLTGNTLRKIGRSGIVIASSSAGDCRDNIIDGCTITEINPDNRASLSAIATACVTFSGQDPCFDNMVVNSVLRPGTYGKWVINDFGEGNVQRDNKMTEGVSGFFITNATSMMETEGKAAFQANNVGGGQSGLVSSAVTVVAFGNLSGDGLYNYGDFYDESTGEFHPPRGRMRGGASVQISGSTTGVIGIILQRKTEGGAFGTYKSRQQIVPTSANQRTMEINFEDITDGDQYYRIAAYAATSTGDWAIVADGATNFWASMH